jgi:ATP-dependent DNA helicase RecG
MDQAQLVALVDQLRNRSRELAVVEFKRNLDKPEDIGEYLSALANAAVLDRQDRGWLVWGIDDHTHAVCGTRFDPFASKGAGNQPLIMWLTQRTSPKADFCFHEVQHPAGRVVLMEIYPPRAAPLAFNQCRYIRIDSHKSRLDQHPDKEARLWALLGPVDDWSGEVVEGATLTDLDPEAIEMARKRFEEYLVKSEAESSRQTKIREEVASWDVWTLLNKALITKQSRITRAALLLLGKDESVHFLAPADVKLTWILRDASNRTESSQHFGLPILLSSEKVFGKIRNIAIEYMPDGSLFPTAVARYDSWVMREALHNCIAHQDYRLGGKVNIVEYPDRLVFSNLGRFIPPSVEWMLDNQSPPEYYRNRWLIGGMIRLRMIDQVGSGIRRMFETQRERFFPLPDYRFDETDASRPRVEVSISGTILDVRYTQLLMKRHDLSLREVLLLDRVQKRHRLTVEEVKLLKLKKLIEGRAPNYFVSEQVAALVGERAAYIRNRGMDDDYYRRLVVEYLERYGKASRQDLDNLLLTKLPDVLDVTQKANKIRNLMQALRRDGQVRREGPRTAAFWRLS